MSEAREPITVEILDVAFGGKGVGKLPSGKACFVPGVLAGERVSVVVGKVGRRFVEARIDALLEASPQRVKSPCPYYAACGGCAYQHVAYPTQLTMKREQIGQVLKRIGGIESPDVREVIASPKEYGYRNRITVHRRGGRVGFHQRDGQGLVDVERCLIASDPVNEALAKMRSDRRSRDGEALTLREHGGRFGFHQTNDEVAALLLDGVDGVCEAGGPLLIDAYCGAGFFARRMAKRFEKVIGIEWNEGSVAIAQTAAGENEEYLAGDVAERLAEVLTHPERERAVAVVDPPAQGLDERVSAALVERPVAKIIYVSCDPSTLARDLKILAAAYDFKFAQPFDMFAQTAEVEVMAVLEAKDRI